MICALGAGIAFRTAKTTHMRMPALSATLTAGLANAIAVADVAQCKAAPISITAELVLSAQFPGKVSGRQVHIQIAR